LITWKEYNNLYTLNSHRGWQQPTKDSILTRKLLRKIMGDVTNCKREGCNRESMVRRIIGLKLPERQ
jgi:hypothetical protein